jgi:Family of unknown function (DUF6464)
VFKTLLVLIIGCLPSLFSLWVIRKAAFRTRERMRQAANTFNNGTFTNGRRIPYQRPLESDRYYLEGVGYLIGDISCKYNARSGYVRCAVNPSGPCEGCRFYESKESCDSLS